MGAYLLHIPDDLHAKIRAKAALQRVTLGRWILLQVNKGLGAGGNIDAEATSEPKSEAPHVEIPPYDGPTCIGRVHKNPDTKSARIWEGGAGTAPHCFKDELCRKGDPECVAAYGFNVNPFTGELMDERHMR